MHLCNWAKEQLLLTSMFCEGIHVPTSVGVVGLITGLFILLFGVLVNTVMPHVQQHARHHMSFNIWCHHMLDHLVATMCLHVMNFISSTHMGPGIVYAE